MLTPEVKEITMKLNHVVALLTLGVVVFTSSSAPADDAVQSPYAATLRKHGIKPDAAGLGKYLRQLRRHLAVSDLDEFGVQPSQIHTLVKQVLD